MKRHKDSHFDHGLTEAQIEYVMERFADRDAFFIETIELPVELGTVSCGLYGPIMGDPTVDDASVVAAPRGARAWKSRLVEWPLRQVRTLTVIAGPHDGHACIVYTMYGGPSAPQEPGDVRQQLEAVETIRRERSMRGEPDPGMGLLDETERARLDPEVYGKIVALRKKREASDTFWRAHALAR